MGQSWSAATDWRQQRCAALSRDKSVSMWSCAVCFAHASSIKMLSTSTHSTQVCSAAPGTGGLGVISIALYIKYERRQRSVCVVDGTVVHEHCCDVLHADTTKCSSVRASFL